MQKSLTIVFPLLAAGILLLGIAPAQNPAATTTQPTKPAATQATTAAQTPKASTAKKSAATTKATTALTLKTEKEKASYALGVNFGAGLRRQGLNALVDPALAGRGFKDSLAGSKLLLTDDEIKAVLTKLQGEVRAKQDEMHTQQEAKAHAEAEPNLKEGDAFLAGNKTKDGVVALPSGLQYKILTAGNGPKPAATDTVTCNYSGKLLNGTEFDSSYKRNEPASFPLTGVIKGWTEALQLMPVGSKWQLFIPSSLAYGDGGRPGIPPGATLIFEVELLSIGEPKK
jgi:FKBP-type peptidyl-prolyl cis-trans isomerase